MEESYLKVGMPDIRLSHRGTLMKYLGKGDPPVGQNTPGLAAEGHGCKRLLPFWMQAVREPAEQAGQDRPVHARRVLAAPAQDRES